VVAVGPVHVRRRGGPDVRVLQHMAGEVRHDQGHGCGHQVQGAVAPPVGARAAARLPGDILRQVGEGRQGDPEADGVCK
jgi:hypothetical protein